MPKRSPGSQADDDINRQFGVRLRFARELAGKSQTEVGEALGVSFQQVQKYENGTTSISLNRLHDVAACLRVPIANLIDGLQGSVQAMGGGMNFADNDQAAFVMESNVGGAGQISRQKQALLNAFTRIGDHKVRRSLVALAEALAGDLPENDGES